MIRLATIEDVVDIYNLETATFNNPYSLDVMNDDLVNDKVAIFVYENNDKIVGYISVYYFLEEANLQKIAVLENDRRKGFASQLINHAIQFLKEKQCKTFYLEVNENNDVAIKVYQKLGFEKISTRSNYYGSNSAIIFQKNLE